MTDDERLAEIRENVEEVDYGSYRSSNGDDVRCLLDIIDKQAAQLEHYRQNAAWKADITQGAWNTAALRAKGAEEENAKLRAALEAVDATFLLAAPGKGVWYLGVWDTVRQARGRTEEGA